MSTGNVTPSLQDFSLVGTHVNRVTKDLGLSKPSLGFCYFALDLILGLQDDEIGDAITDTAYLMETMEVKGHDRGVDAVYIDEQEIPAVVHLFNCKYTEQFKKVTSHYPAGEIDKICGFLSALIQHDDNLIHTINPILASKVQDIWNLYQTQSPRFAIHVCSNSYLQFEEGESKRFEREVKKYSHIEIKCHLMPDFVSILTRRGKQVVNARLRAIDRNLFEKSDGDIRALIVDIDTRELLRIVINDEALRQAVDLTDYAILKEKRIFEDAFEDNVRVYLKQRSKINRNIKETALSEESHRFFYFNNGITITCTEFKYPKGVRAPIIELANLQVVNGSQTIHALYEAFLTNYERFEEMDILVRIYETHNDQLSTDIAEYTNSQNPVKSRDIRSNDFAQKKLESELRALGYFYERKKGQYAGQPKNRRIDAEKAGQALMAFYNKMPAEAKDEKRVIFAEKYEQIFADEITADKLLTAVQLFYEIERRKLAKKQQMLQDPSLYETESFVLHASYYIMYVISELADLRSINKSMESYPDLLSMYDEASGLVMQATIKEQTELAGYKETYTHRMFFKGNRPKKHLEALVSSVA